jgi:hypothetical protein
VDLSPEYVKMCGKAKEIQDSRPLDGGFDSEMSWAWIDATIHRCLKCGFVIGTPFCPQCGGTSNIEHEGYVDTLSSAERSDYDNVWLPRQDQLQDMIGGMTNVLDLLDRHFNAERIDYGVISLPKDTQFYQETFTSMEQLWLAFTMKILFSKEWTGEAWE